ncbi:hypothetical protein CGI32_15400 [Vibrio parahaemolyticus]|nr:hypothetical protein BTZ05_22335 [Vibrio parahaemolyticus]TOE40664.1 hypothetical protein CGJ45_13880 [Vibrio parahaemolyticus]TOJ84369.1 hypothetical protein CGI32_15400 [Vibrio parahaemolyticus]
MDNFPLKTRQHTYGLKKQLVQEPRNNNLNMLICSVQSVAEEELVRLSLSLDSYRHHDRARQSRRKDVTPSLWMKQNGIQKKLPMTLKCQCHQTFSL